MLDVGKLRKEALVLIKQGCVEVKQDSSKISLIELGISKLNQLPGDDLFTKLVCAIGYEKMSMYQKSIELYDYCIDSLPDSSIKYGITGMKYRVLAKKSPFRRKENINQSMEWYNKAFEIETNCQWKHWWEISIKEVQRIK